MNRLPLLAPGLISLFLGLYGGLARTGVLISPPEIMHNHGALMISGFIATLIALERYVALRRWWWMSSYLLLGAGGIMVATGISIGYLLWILGAAAFMMLHLFLLLRFRQGYHHFLMLAGSLLLLWGNTGLYLGQPLYSLVEAWTGFLVLFVIGERVELARVTGFRFPESLGVIASALLLIASTILGSGVTSINLAALAMIILPISVMRYDVGLRFMGGRGFQRFLSVGLATAYAWLVAGGFLWLLTGYSDPALHTVFIGFTGTMILTHAPVIIPVIIRTRHFYSRTLYAPLILLQASIILRVASTTIAGGLPLSGILTVLAVGVYIVIAAYNSALKHD